MLFNMMLCRAMNSEEKLEKIKSQIKSKLTSIRSVSSISIIIVIIYIILNIINNSDNILITILQGCSTLIIPIMIAIYSHYELKKLDEIKNETFSAPTFPIITSSVSEMQLSVNHELNEYNFSDTILKIEKIEKENFEFSVILDFLNEINENLNFEILEEISNKYTYNQMIKIKESPIDLEIYNKYLEIKKKHPEINFEKLSKISIESSIKLFKIFELNLFSEDLIKVVNLYLDFYLKYCKKDIDICKLNSICDENIFCELSKFNFCPRKYEKISCSGKVNFDNLNKIEKKFNKLVSIISKRANIDIFILVILFIYYEEYDIYKCLESNEFDEIYKKYPILKENCPAFIFSKLTSN